MHHLQNNGVGLLHWIYQQQYPKLNLSEIEDVQSEFRNIRLKKDEKLKNITPVVNAQDNIFWQIRMQLTRKRL